MSSAYATLQVIGDARQEGREASCAALADEFVGLVHVRRGLRKTMPIRPRPWPAFAGGGEDYDYEPPADAETPEDFTARLVLAMQKVRETNWLKWMDPTKLVSFQAIYKKLYTTERVADLAMRPHPMLAMMRRS